MRANIVTMLTRLTPLRATYSSEAWRRVVRKTYMDIFGHMAEVGALWPFIGNSTASPSPRNTSMRSSPTAVSPAAGLEQAADGTEALSRW